MSESLVADSIMTADGEVVPLGPVDKDGHRVPLDTTSLYGPRGERYKVKSFVHSPLMDGWFMECAFTHDLIDVSSLRLKAPDSWEKLLEDLNEGANHSEYSSCFYFRKAECDCSLCKADCYSNCDQPVFKDIASRIRRLRGEVREDASRFIKLYDDNGYEYIVNMDKITCVDIAGKKVWTEGKTTLDICDKSMDYLRRRLVGDGK